MADPRAIIEGIRNFEEAAGEFIRDGPSTGLPGYVRDGYRERCRQFANLPPWARLLGNGPSGALDRICTPYWADNGWDGPEANPPDVIGGQCPGVSYRYTATGFDRGNVIVNNVRTCPSNAFGPIGVRRLLNGAGNFVEVQVTFFTAAGAPVFATFISGNPANVTGTITNVVRCDGQLDDCGDSPTDGPRVGPNPPPDPGPVVGPPPTDNPGNPTGPPLIPLPPYNDPIYGPTPIEGPTGPTGPPGGGGNDPVGGPGSPGDGGDTGTGGENEGSADEGDELVGVLVQVLTAPQGANRFFNNSELVYRGPYYVAMGYPGRLGLDMSGGTAETLQFFHAQQRGLTDYRVRANVGFNLRVTPYYRELES